MIFKRKKRGPSGTDLTRMKDRAAQYIARKDWSNALRALKIAWDLSPDDTYLARKIGDVCQRLGRIEEAVEAYKTAARLFAEEGFLYKAISVNNVVLSLQPNDLEVQQALEVLHSQRSKNRLVEVEHLVPADGTASSKVVGVYLDRVNKQTLMWIPLISELQDEELTRFVEMMVRKKKRLNIMKRVDFEYQGEGLFAYTRDLSSGGSYLRSQTIVPEGTDIELALDLEVGKDPVRVYGQVVRAIVSGDHRGFGVRFDQEGQDPALEQINEFVLATLEKNALGQLDRNPTDIDALYDLADISRERRDLEQTEHYLRKITEIKTPSVAHGYLAEVVLARSLETGDESKAKEAQQLFSIALQLEKDRALETARDTLKSRFDIYQEKNAWAKPVIKSDELDSASAGVDVDVDTEWAFMQLELEKKQQDLKAREERLLERESELDRREQALEQRERALARQNGQSDEDQDN